MRPLTRPTVFAALLGGIAVSTIAGCGNSTGGTEPTTVTTVIVESEAAPGTASASTHQREHVPAPGSPAPAASGRSKADFPYFSFGDSSSALGDRYPNQTSEAFGRAVYDAFIDNWIRTGDPYPTLNVYSPTTGQTYTMSCGHPPNPHPTITTILCTGGNNAKVRIYDALDPTVDRGVNSRDG